MQRSFDFHTIRRLILPSGVYGKITHCSAPRSPLPSNMAELQWPRLMMYRTVKAQHIRPSCKSRAYTTFQAKDFSKMVENISKESEVNQREKPRRERKSKPEAAPPPDPEDLISTIPEPINASGPRLTAWTYEPQWPREGTKQRIVAPIPTTKQVSWILLETIWACPL